MKCNSIAQVDSAAVDRRRFLTSTTVILLLSIDGAANAAPRRPDLASGLVGVWAGDVVSNAQGPGRSGVAVSITQVGANTVQIASEDGSLPTITVTLERAANAVVNHGGDSALSFSNGRLDISFHNQVSWSGHRPDLADQMSGTWFGDVISDSQGSGRTGVTLTITRVAPNTVQVNSDYPRLPVVVVELEKAMTAIVMRTGDTAFVFNKNHLDVSFHNQVSWSGQRPGRQ